MYDVLRFWLERGVDGFRVDVLWHMIKDSRFRDDPLNPDYREGQPDFRRVRALYSADQPEVLEIAQEMRRVLAAYPGERLLIGEIYLPVERLAAYYGPELSAVHLPFNFNLMWAPWRPDAIMRLIQEYEAVLPAGGWPSWVLGNHDQRRIASRVGPAQARVAMVLLLTLRGTPTLYNGDELGLENVPIPPERARDPFGLNMPGTDQGRDPVRTPMPWDRTAHCGFTTGEPWLPLGADHAARSVEAQKQRPGLDAGADARPARAAAAGAGAVLGRLVAGHGRGRCPRVRPEQRRAARRDGSELGVRTQSGPFRRAAQGADRALDAPGTRRPAYRRRHRPG